MNRSIIIVFILMAGLCLHVYARPHMEEPVDAMPQDSVTVQVDTLPAGMADTVYRVLYSEQPIVRPIHYSKP